MIQQIVKFKGPKGNELIGTILDKLDLLTFVNDVLPMIVSGYLIEDVVSKTLMSVPASALLEIVRPEE